MRGDFAVSRAQKGEKVTPYKKASTGAERKRNGTYSPTQVPHGDRKKIPM